jgi:tetratricopeptide (TPR) repeat protein
MVGAYYQAHFKISDAILFFRKALEQDRSYAEARSNLGNAYLQLGRIDDGLNELMITEKTNRFDAIDTGILYYNIGKAFNLKGMPDQAIQNLNRARLYIPNEGAIFSLLGEVYQKKNMPAESSACLKRARELDPAKY